MHVKLKRLLYDTNSEAQWYVTTLCLYSVCSHLVANGEKQDEDSVGGWKRSAALQTLCKMCPQQAVAVRNMCVSSARTNKSKFSIT